MYKISGKPRQWATGAITTQREVYIGKTHYQYVKEIVENRIVNYKEL